MNILYLSIIGLSLSLDTFSFSLSLGSFNLKKQKVLIFPLIVGVFHFFMPLLGNGFGKIIQKFIIVNPNFLLGLIFLFLALEMFFSKEEKEYDLSLLGMILYAFSVSIDSLTVGIGLNSFNSNPFLASLLFCIISGFFTYLGLCLGKYSYKKLGKVAKIIGIIILTLLAIIHFFKA